jgi:hypothetical protein
VGIGKIEGAPGGKQRSDRLGPADDIGEPADRPPGREHDVELAFHGLPRGIDISANKIGRDSDLRCQTPGFGNRRRRKIEPGRDRTRARQDQRIEPEMALQMDQPPAGNLAEFPAVDRVEPFFSGEKSLDRIKARRVAAVDRHPLVPVAPVGCAKFVLPHRSDPDNAMQAWQRVLLAPLENLRHYPAAR